MIGVPASTPKTPTLVIVNVPPLISAGWVLPSRAVAVSSLSAAAELEQRQRVGVLDVRDDQPARGGRGDAEVDVALEDDLLGRLVPGRVDLRRTAHRQAAPPGPRTSSGETLTSRNSRRALSRSTSSIVRVTSTVTHSVTCGAVKAESTIACAIILRTPLIGSRRLALAASARAGPPRAPHSQRTAGGRRRGLRRPRG